MPTDPRRPVLAASMVACLAAALLLGGCADDTAPQGSPAASAPSAPTNGADAGVSGGSGSSGKSSASSASGSGSPGQPSGAGSGADAGAGADAEPSTGGGADPSGAVLEVPVAAAPTVDSLGELLGDADRALVTAPLPRAASARGRLVGGFPAALRPAPGSRVETSSVSPAGDRLQVALVGSTALAPEQVLLAFRTRLARRGLVEQASAVQTAPGSQATALQRGRSVVTITVTQQDARTRYSVIASLHTGHE